MRTNCRSASEFGMTMKRSGRSCLGILVGLHFLVAGMVPGWAAAYYADNSASGSNSGTSWTNAWHGFDHVVWGAGGVKAGDTLYISGGSTSKAYSATAAGMLTVGASGTSGSPITIATGAKSPSPTGHDGIVVFEGGGTQVDLINASNRSYVVIDGEKSGARNWTIQNSAISSNGFAIYIMSAISGKLTYLTVTGVGCGINATYCNALEVSYCSITDIRWDTGIRNIEGNAGATEYGLSKIHHNTIQTNYTTVNGAGPDGLQIGRSTDIYSNSFYSTAGTIAGAQHPDFVQTQGMYLRIYNNTFRNAIDSAIDVDGTGNWKTDMQHLWIYNNVFVHDSSCYGSVAPWPSGIRYYNGVNGLISDVVIANNTFVDWSGDGTYGGNCIAFTLAGAETLSDVIIKNNLFYNAARSNYNLIDITASSGSTAADWSVDYNLANAGAHGVVAMRVDGSTYIQAHPRTGVPTFVLYNHTDPNNDFHLSELDIAAKDQGIDLSSHFTTDKDGVSRPNGAAWDIGAYELSGGGMATPTSPSGLRVKQ
jgi:hypothetical protein